MELANTEVNAGAFIYLFILKFLFFCLFQFLEGGLAFRLIVYLAGFWRICMVVVFACSI